MPELTELWLPILLSAVFVFVVSSIVHMMIPIHWGDYKKLPQEATLLDSMRAANPAPGCYMFPRAESPKDMGSPEMLEKYKQGPVGMMTVLPTGMPAMGKNLLLWFIYSIFIGTCAAYVCSMAVPRGADYMLVFRMTGTAALLAYGVGFMHDSIWKGVPWGITGRYLFDGLLYALTTAGTFAWLWPDAV